MDGLRRQNEPFDVIDPLDIFDEDLLDDPEHPKRIGGIQIHQGVFTPREPDNDEDLEWALWQQVLMLAGLLLVTYAWYLVLSSTRPRLLPAEERVRSVSVRLEPLVTKNPADDKDTEIATEPTAAEAEPLESETPVSGKQVPEEKHPEKSLPGQSINRLIRAYVDELNDNAVHSPDSESPPGVPLNRGTVVFDSKFKKTLESQYVSEINAQKQSGHKDTYRNIYGDAVSRSGTVCATTIRNPGIGEWTYYSGCTQPPDKLRRFGNELNRSGVPAGKSEQ